MTSRQNKNLALLFLACLPCAACRKTAAPVVADAARLPSTSAAAPVLASPPQLAPATSTQSSPANPVAPASKSGKSIHDVNVEEFVVTHYAELDPDLEILKDGCGEGQEPIRSVEIQYGDVDGDGQDEALFQGFTCMSGSAGSDYAGIVKLQPGGKLVGLPIAKIPDSFKGRDPFESLRGHVSWNIEKNRFVETYPVYKSGDECEACSSGGDRKFVFRWDGHQFVLDDIIDIPPDKAGN